MTRRKLPDGSWAPDVERRRCICRGVIESEPDERSIELAVGTHNRQPEHRAAVELAALEREKVTAPRVRVTIHGDAVALGDGSALRRVPVGLGVRVVRVQ